MHTWCMIENRHAKRLEGACTCVNNCGEDFLTALPFLVQLSVSARETQAHRRHRHHSTETRKTQALKCQTRQGRKNETKSTKTKLFSRLALLVCMYPMDNQEKKGGKLSLIRCVHVAIFGFIFVTVASYTQVLLKHSQLWL